MTWDDLDEATKQLFYGTYGEDAPQVWAQQNAANMAALPTYSYGGMPQGYGQDPGTAAYTVDLNGNVTGYSSGQGSNRPGGGVSNGVDLSSLVYPGRPFQMGPTQAAPLGTSTYGPSMYWADSVQATPRPGEVNVQRDRNQLRYFNAQGQIVRVETVPPNDPTYGPDGRIKNTNQLEAVSSPYHYETTRGDVQGEYAPLADYFLRSDTPTGITTEPIPQGMQDLLQRAISAGVVRQASGPRPGAAGAAGAAGAGGTGAGGTGVTSEQQYWQNRAAMEAADQAAKQVYNAWLMRTGDDRLAMEKAQQAWSQSFQEKQFEYTKTQNDRSFGLQEAGLTGTYNGQETLAARNQREQLALAKQAQEQAVAQNYLGLIAGLRGPANYAQYARVLNSTPGGIRDIVNAAAGRYQMASGNSGNTSGVGTTPATLGTLFQDASQGVPMPDYSGLAAPNQINAANYNAYNPSQKDLLMAGYEASGYDTRDVMDQYLKSLPRYGGPRQAGLGLG